MSIFKKEPDSEKSVTAWILAETDLHSRYFIRYSLLIAFFLTLGVITLGAEFNGNTHQENLLVNFLWCSALMLGMAFTAFWYRLIFGWNSLLLQDTYYIYEKLDKFKDEEYEITKKQLSDEGKLPPSKLQIAAMVFIGCYFLFEFFIVSATVHDYQLIWESDWLKSFFTWVIDSTSGGPSKQIPIRFKSDDFSHSPPFSTLNFSNELEFLHLPQGHTLIAFALWRTIMFLPTLIAFGIVFAKSMGLVGLNGINILYTKGVVNFFGRVVFNLLASPLLLTVFLFFSPKTSFENMMTPTIWIALLRDIFFNSDSSHTYYWMALIVF